MAALNLGPVVALLAGPPFKLVGSLFDLASLRTEPKLALPAAFVLPDSESAAPEATGSSIFEQLVTSLFAVVIVAGGDSLRRDRDLEHLAELEGAVIDRLFARPLLGLDRPLAYVDARILGLEPGRVSRLLRFRATWRLRRVIQP